jgi:hypothetical protein
MRLGGQAALRNHQPPGGFVDARNGTLTYPRKNK